MTWGYFRWPAVCGSGSILCPVLAGVRGAASSGRASAGEPVRVLVGSSVVQPKALGCSIAAFQLDQAARGSALGIHLTGSVGVGRPGWDQWGSAAGEGCRGRSGVGRTGQPRPGALGLIMDPDRSAESYTVDYARDPNCSH